MVQQLWRGAICLLLASGAAGLVADPAALVTGGGGASETDPASAETGRVKSDVLLKRFVLGSPAANTYTVSTDVSYLITFVFNVMFLGAITVAVASAAQQAGEAASDRRRDRLEHSPLERRSSPPVRHRRRQVPFAATLAPDTVHAIVEHVSGPGVDDGAAAAAAAPAQTAISPSTPAASAAPDDYNHYAGYERYPSRYDEQTNSPEKRFKPSSVADILDYLYETDRSLYDELQLRVARRSLPLPPPRGAKDKEYAEYLASVYGYRGLKRDRDGYGGLKRDRDGYGGLDGDRDDWKADQELAQLSYRVTGGAGLSGKVPYEEDPLGAPPKYRQR